MKLPNFFKQPKVEGITGPIEGDKGTDEEFKLSKSVEEMEAYEAEAEAAKTVVSEERIINVRRPTEEGKTNPEELADPWNDPEANRRDSREGLGN
jgi:hypothetical protein